MKQIDMPVKCVPTLALGGDIANAVCFAAGKRAYLSEPVGDLQILENFERFRENIRGMVKRMGVPELIVHDLHPGYMSSKYAGELAEKFSSKAVKVQHHQAHVFGAAAENGLRDFVGIACDGLGYGDDDGLWGGEIFDVEGKKTERIGHLEKQPQLGGDSAAVHPKKMLFGILSKFMVRKGLSNFFGIDEIDIYLKQLESGFNVFQTTSTGRVLDAVSALLGVCEKRTYEGQPAIELEKFAGEDFFEIDPVVEKGVLNTTKLFEFLVGNLDKDKRKLAATAQMYLAEGLYKIADNGKPIVFSGGVAYNKIISGYLKKKGVLLHKKVSPGDSGLAYGQAYLGNIITMGQTLLQ